MLTNAVVKTQKSLGFAYVLLLLTFWLQHELVGG